MLCPERSLQKTAFVSIRSTLAHSGFGLVLTVSALAVLLVQILLQWEMAGAALASLPLYGAAFCLLFFASRLLLRVPVLRTPGLAAYHILFILHFSACFLFNSFFEDAVHRRYSLLDADGDNVAYLLESILPKTVLVWLLIGLTVVYGSAWIFRHIVSNPRRLTAFLFLAAAVGAWNFQSRPALHAFVASDVRDYFSGSLLGPATRSQFELQDFRGEPAAIQGRYRRVILFVMESITVNAMEKECSERPCIFQKLSSNSHVYSQYFSANQDSRTGILSLLQSTFIPYAAYAERDVQQYQRIAGKPGLLQTLSQAGYSTALAASIADKERVLMDLPWSRIYMLTEQQARGGREFLCLHPYEFERSCEDRILMDALVEYLAREPRAFLLHEFIFGHSTEYNELSGKSSVRYYSDFIEEMLTRLAAGGTLEDTLVIITSDHGIRDRSTLGNAESYHIPLIFWNPAFEQRLNSGFFAPMDFARILAHEEAGSWAVSRRQNVPIMGYTGSAMMGNLSRDRSLLILGNRRSGARLLHAECASKSGPCAEPANLLPALDAFRAEFQSSLPR